MTLIAEFRVTGDGVLLLPALSKTPGMTLTLERTAVDDEGTTHFLWGAGGDFEAFERAVETDPTVASFDLLEDAGDSRLYCVSPNPQETTTVAHIDRELGVSRLSLTASSDGVWRRMRFPDGDTMQEYLQRMRAEGFDIHLERVHESDENGNPSRWGLSEKQRDALQHALAAGYYDVPRRAELADVADRLGISRQAASERLRRGVRQLLDDTVGGADAEESHSDR